MCVVNAGVPQVGNTFHTSCFVDVSHTPNRHMTVIFFGNIYRKAGATKGHRFCWRDNKERSVHEECANMIDEDTYKKIMVPDNFLKIWNDSEKLYNKNSGVIQSSQE